MLFTPYDPLRIVRFADHVPALKSGEIGQPTMLLWYPSLTCSEHCSWCFYLPEHEPAAFMPVDTAQTMFQDAKLLGVQGVELCGGGEPLQHPQIMELLEDGLMMGLKFGVLTHGAVKNPRLMSLIARRFSYIRCSVDYADADLYAQTRGTSPKMYDLVVSNIQQMLTERQDSGIQINIKATVHRQTPEQVADFIRLGIDLGVDSIQFKKCDYTVADGLDAEPDRAMAIEQVLREYQNVAQEVKAQGGAYPRILWNFGALKLTHRCWITPIHVFVSTNGDVKACCYSQGREEQHTFGNIYQTRLRDLWGSEAHRRVLAMTDPAHCNNFSCRFIGYMQTLEMARQDAQLEFV